MDSAGKKKKNGKWTGARAATAGPCCSCQRDSLAAGKLLALSDNKPPALLTVMILAHMAMNGGKAQ